MKLEIEDVLSGLECSGRSCSKAFVCRTKRAVYFLLAFLDFFVFAGTISSLPQFSAFLRRLSLFGVVYEVS